METFGQRLRRLRTEAGLSQSTLAKLVPISQASLSRYESGLQAVDPDVARRLDALLHADGALLALLAGTHAASTLVGDGLAQALGEAAAFIYDSTPDLSATIEEHTRQFRRLDDFIGGRELYPAVKQVIDAASRACRHGTTALPDLAELGQIGGWIASDAGQRSAAAQHYLSAARAAHDGGRQDLAASALSSLAYQMANEDSMAERAEAVLLASSVAERADGIGRALLMERLAWTHARVGDAASTLRVLDHVDEVFATAQEPTPSWAYWLNQDEITVMRVRCMVELNRPNIAIDLLSDALSRYDPNYAREHGLYTTYLAEALVKAGDETEARRLLDVTQDANSARLEQRLHTLT
jgi:transcriptional regulator with XRE-family HTH domain